MTFRTGDVVEAVGGPWSTPSPDFGVVTYVRETTLLLGYGPVVVEWYRVGRQRPMWTSWHAHTDLRLSLLSFDEWRALNDVPAR